MNCLNKLQIHILEHQIQVNKSSENQDHVIISSKYENELDQKISPESRLNQKRNYKKFSIEDFDFSPAVLAQKDVLVDARPIAKGNTIVTKIKGEEKEETTKTTRCDGMVVTDVGDDLTDEDKKTEYVVDLDKFNSLYTETEKKGRYRCKPNPKLFLKVHKDITFVASWGEEMNIPAGGYITPELGRLTKNNGKFLAKNLQIYGIYPDLFDRNYKVLDKTPDMQEFTSEFDE